ncbi:hypothetical protein WG66_009535 [Moniliophthora roreri]|nr:hypothetical protein WG66_009535 [Moniliophthora roreri]
MRDEQGKHNCGQAYSFGFIHIFISVFPKPIVNLRTTDAYLFSSVLPTGDRSSGILEEHDLQRQLRKLYQPPFRNNYPSSVPTQGTMFSSFPPAIGGTNLAIGVGCEFYRFKLPRGTTWP